MSAMILNIECNMGYLSFPMGILTNNKPDYIFARLNLNCFRINTRFMNKLI